MSNTAKALHGGKKQPMSEKKGTLFKVSPYMVRPSTSGDFSLYLKQEGKLVLYAEKGEMFTDAHIERLGRMDVQHLYVKADEQRNYFRYVQKNLANLLADDVIPVKERARAWSDATLDLARKAFDRSLPKPMNKLRFQRIRTLIQNSLKFFARDDALKELSRFISQGNRLYHHGIGTMVMTVSVLNMIYKDDTDLMVACGMGAMLHDIGKLELDEDLFRKRFDQLSHQERDLVKSHPALGVGICSSLPLPQETLQCILFHHEREDGTGYPSGAQGEMLPTYVKVLSLCNEYDNLTRGYRAGKKFTPFEALTHIKSNRAAVDPELLKKLILVLSKAELT